jgi:hypothetical protein
VQGLVPLAGHEGETSTRGLDSLEAQCREYVKAGAKFAKWRAALRIGDHGPSEEAVAINAEQLGQYAKICQVGWWQGGVGRGGGWWWICRCWVLLQGLCDLEVSAAGARHTCSCHVML